MPPERRPGSYAHIARDDEEPSRGPELPGGKWGAFVLWLLPVVFGAGTTVAAVKYQAAEVERLDNRVEQIATAMAERDKRIQQLEIQVGQAERERDASVSYRVDLQSRVSRMERNLAVLCTQRGASCER